MTVSLAAPHWLCKQFIPYTTFIGRVMNGNDIEYGIVLYMWLVVWWL